MDWKDRLLFGPPEIGCVLSLTGLPGSGSRIYDRSPYGKVGTITGATWKQLPSGLWCLYFDGTDDFASIGAGEFDTLTQCTVEFWFRPDIDLDGQATDRILFDAYKDASNWIQIYYSHTGNNISLLGYDGAVALYCGRTGDEGKSQQWHQWASVFGEHGGGEAWIDLTSIGTDARTFCVSDLVPTIANFISVSGQAWSGDIALFRIHNRRLSLLEIQNHFNQEKHLFGVW